jgi:HEAT repeat protein
MSGEGRQGPEPIKVTRGFRINLRMLIALVACCAAVFWSARVVWQSTPANGWARSLRSGNAADRLAAARQLGSIEPGEAGVAIPALISVLGDPDEEVSTTAARSLGSAGLAAIRTPTGRQQLHAAAEALTRALTDRRVAVRTEAALTLYVFTQYPVGEEGLPFDCEAVAAGVAAVIRDPSPKLRVEARRVLFAIGSKALIAPPPALVAALSGDESADVRANAAAALGGFRTGIRVAILPLIKALKDRDPGVRHSAVLALGGIGPEARAAIPALIAILNEPFVPAPAVPPPAAASPGVGFFNRTPLAIPRDPACEAARALGSIASGMGPSDGADAAIAALTEALQSEHAERRGAAAQGLHTIGPRASAAAQALVAALTKSIAANDDPGNDSWISRALGMVAPGSASAGEAIGALTLALDSKDKVGLRMYAVDSLGRFGPAASAAVPRLRVLQEEPDGIIAGFARAALGRIEAKPRPAGSSTN